MPKINKIFSGNTKKIDISDFFSDVMEENEKAYVHVNKLSPIVQRKIQIASINKMSKNQEIFKKVSKIGEEITDDQMMEIIVNSDISAQSDVIKLQQEIEEIVINDGIDQLNHNFTDENDKKIKLNYKTLLQFNDLNLLNHLVKEIQSFSRGVIIKK